MSTAFIACIVAVAMIVFAFRTIGNLDRCPNCGKWAGMMVQKVIEFPASPDGTIAAKTVCHKKCSRCGHRETIT